MIPLAFTEPTFSVPRTGDAMINEAGKHNVKGLALVSEG
jgi:hypothetical protein